MMALLSKSDRSDIVDGMVEYVTMSVLALHRDLVPYIAMQRSQGWQQMRIWPASSRHVGVLGLGVLGEAACRKLAGFGFQVAGWSGSRCEIDGVACSAGPDEMAEFLARSEILVCLPPPAGEARIGLDAALFAKLPRGAKLLSAGSRDHLDQDALLAALDDGQVSVAMLDVSSEAQLPKGHALWSDPRVLITSHIAGMI